MTAEQSPQVSGSVTSAAQTGQYKNAPDVLFLEPDFGGASMRMAL
jgi:hypothetical protein